MANGESSNGRNGRGLLIGGGIGIGSSLLATVLGIAWNTLREDARSARDEMRSAIRELREENRVRDAELRRIQDLAAERGKILPEHERRLEKLEQGKR